MDFRRICASLLLAGTALVATATPALAHAGLKSSNPAEGASLATAPTSIQLTFGEAVTPSPDAVKVTGPDGTQWPTGEVTAVDAVVTAPVQPSGPAGKYTVTYKVKSADGDNVSGAVHFTLTTAVAPASTTPPSPTTSAAPPSSVSPPPISNATPAPQADNATGSAGLPAWVPILIAIAVIAAIAGGFLARRSRRSSGPDGS
jgi:methionine-rich copper-binding protein CopC